MIARILLVEDDAALAAVLRDTLEAAGYEVTRAGDGPAALQAAAEQAFSLVVLDVMLPGSDGFTVCATLRERGLLTPVLMLSARAGRQDRIRGLTVGADDYVTKPFDPEELLARVHALLRRWRAGAAAAGNLNVEYQVGDIRVNFLTGVVCRGAQRLFLSTKELQLFHYLVRHCGRVTSREELLREVWGCGASLTRTVDVHVATLRQKLEADPKSPALVLTVRGEGYRLGAEVKDSLPCEQQQLSGEPRLK